ncbi:hypothetical protein EPA93_42945 [Ktedonosporobacter rubrisoli]|uniref:Uncharacterized protein n=1 Tax=Ktedonosporobacter rubrisoli TaxID=2509675 RepID=A0A4P6K2W8_KTERU|nr:hypothetical protein [Ktedonosporobacter rubrisoli]QBD82375.1 hypothetical protein EPA93_42945 [Ktedonosporobacter rubrisoli]
MFIQALMAVTVAESGGIRALLLVLVLVAIVLLLAGAAIAVLTFLNLRKAQAAQAGHAPGA